MHIYAPMWQTPDRHTESERRRHATTESLTHCALSVTVSVCVCVWYI